jgi:hypothetical protein
LKVAAVKVEHDLQCEHFFHATLERVEPVQDKAVRIQQEDAGHQCSTSTAISYKHDCGCHEAELEMTSSRGVQVTSHASCGLATNLTLFHCRSGAPSYRSNCYYVTSVSVRRHQHSAGMSACQQCTCSSMTSPVNHKLQHHMFPSVGSSDRAAAACHACAATTGKVSTCSSLCNSHSQPGSSAAINNSMSALSSLSE